MVTLAKPFMVYWKTWMFFHFNPTWFVFILHHVKALKNHDWDIDKPLCVFDNTHDNIH